MARKSLATLEQLESRTLMSSESLLSLLAGAQSVELQADGAVSVESQLQDTSFEVYQFTAPARGTMYIDMSSPDGSLDPMLKLLNSRGRRVRINDNASHDTLDSLIKVRVRAGQTYYLVADGKGVQGSYRVRFVSQAVDDYGNTAAEAQTITLSSRNRASIGGTINYVGDVDMFRLAATRTGTLSLSMAARRSMVDPEITVLDADGNELADGAGSGSGATLTLDVVAGQVYYIQASGSDTTGRYALGASLAAPAPAPAPSPDPTPDPTPIVVDDSGLTPGATVTARVVSVSNGLQLQIAGTDGDDVMTLSQTVAGLTLVSAAGTQSFAGAFASVVMYGFAGNDTIRTTYSVSVPAYIDGGDGNDQVYANGQGNATLLGGAGDDLLVSIGGAAAALTGGDGSDSFWYDSGDRVADASGAETAVGALHRVSQFYQPYTTTQGAVNYVPLTLDGQVLADPQVNSYASGYRNFAYKPLFVDGPQYDDVAQGAVGDCYFMAAVAGMADSDPGIVTQAITSLGDGTYAVRFFHSGQSYYLRLDADLPVYSGSNPAYAGFGADGELWVPLIEKAFAYFRTGQNSYASIEGGWMNEVYPLLSGQSVTSRSTSGMASDLYNYLGNQLAQGHAVSMGSKYGITGPIVGSHGYDVKSVQTIDGVLYVTVYNPWGEDGRSYDSNYYDGLLTITISQVQQYFTTVNVSLA